MKMIGASAGAVSNLGLEHVPSHFQRRSWQRKDPLRIHHCADDYI